MWENYLAYRDRIQSLIEQRACFPPENEQLVTADGLKTNFVRMVHFMTFMEIRLYFGFQKIRNNFLEKFRRLFMNRQQEFYQKSFL